MSINQLRQTKKPLFTSFSVAASIGAVFGIWFIGFKNFFPWNYQWLYSNGDGALTQLSFEFYRNSPLFQWPITAVPQYISGSGMILPTENAITNFIAKLIGLVVPGSFQFVGIWLVICFSLQGYFGAKLISRFGVTALHRILGSVFFVASPALLYRTGVMNHYHLGAHWMILLALYLYFDSRNRVRAWAVLLPFAMLTSIYIATMLLGIFVAHQVKLYLGSQKLTVKDVSLPLISALGGFFVMGYLEMESTVTGSNFFRLNLISFLNPGFSDTGSFSLLLDALGGDTIRRVFSEEWEGFQYLGTIAIIGVLVGVWRAPRSPRRFPWRQFAPILIVAIGMFLFALSNRIVFLQNEYRYWWPSQLLDLRQIFRGTTRFAWPAYYLLMLFSVVQLSRFIKTSKRQMLLLVVLFLMLIESSTGIWFARQEMADPVTREDLMLDSAWEKFAEGRKHVIIYPNFDLQVGELLGEAKYWETRWLDVALYASKNEMSTNFGYAPRPLTSFIKEQDAQVLSDLESGNLRSHTLYFISDKEKWSKWSLLNTRKTLTFELDGFHVIALID
jgi:hypothetical protein